MKAEVKTSQREAREKETIKAWILLEISQWNIEIMQNIQNIIKTHWEALGTCGKWWNGVNRVWQHRNQRQHPEKSKSHQVDFWFQQWFLGFLGLGQQRISQRETSPIKLTRSRERGRRRKERKKEERKKEKRREGRRRGVVATGGKEQKTIETHWEAIETCGKWGNRVNRLCRHGIQSENPENSPLQRLDFFKLLLGVLSYYALIPRLQLCVAWSWSHKNHTNQDKMSIQWRISNWYGVIPSQRRVASRSDLGLWCSKAKFGQVIFPWKYLIIQPGTRFSGGTKRDKRDTIWITITRCSLMLTSKAKYGSTQENVANTRVIVVSL